MPLTRTQTGVRGLAPVVGLRGPRRKPNPPNLLRWSEAFDNAAWSTSALTVAPNATTGPGGAAGADLLIEGASTGLHAISQAPAGSGALAAFCGSVYAKAQERSQIQIALTSNVVHGNCIIDLTTGAVVSNTFGTPIVADAGGGWWRVAVTGVSASTITELLTIRLVSGGNNSYAGDGTSGLYVWGAQLVRGTAPSPYQPKQ